MVGPSTTARHPLLAELQFDKGPFKNDEDMPPMKRKRGSVITVQVSRTTPAILRPLHLCGMIGSRSSRHAAWLKPRGWRLEGAAPGCVFPFRFRLHDSPTCPSAWDSMHDRLRGIPSVSVRGDVLQSIASLMPHGAEANYPHGLKPERQALLLTRSCDLVSVEGVG